MKTAQEIARHFLSAKESETWSDDAARYFNALSEIANLPESPPFALPVSGIEAMRVDRVISVWRMNDGSAAIRTCPTDDVASVVACGEYAAAWLRLFGVSEKEASK